MPPDPPREVSLDATVEAATGVAPTVMEQPELTVAEGSVAPASY